MTNTLGVTNYTYDVLDRMTQVTSPNGTLGYGYDLNGNRTALTYPGSKTVQYTYDAANRLTTVKDWANRTTSYTYDAANRQTNIAYPNAVQAVSTYDKADQLLSIVHTSPVDGVIAKVVYTLDAAGNRLTMADLDGTTYYTYDQLHRLTGVTYPNGEVVTYSYDAMGNRTSMASNVGGTTSYSYDAGDRLLSYVNGVNTTNLAWDANGNMTGKGSAAYTFNVLDRLTQVVNGATTVQFGYDGDGTRQSKTVNSTTTSYLQDVAVPLPIVVVETTSGQGSKYINGAELLMQVDPGDTPSYYHADGLGSTRALSNQSGQRTNTYSYDVFGAVRAQQESLGQPFKFTGEQVDQELGLQYLRSRYYDWEQGRFINKDVWPGSKLASQSLNRYAYANNNPVVIVDPSGLFGVFDNMSGTDKLNWLETFSSIGAGETSPTDPSVINDAVGTAATLAGSGGIAQASSGVGAVLSTRSASAKLDSIWAEPNDAELNEFAVKEYGQGMTQEDLSDPLIRDIVRLDQHYTTRPKKIIDTVDVTMSTVGGPVSTGYNLVKVPGQLQRLWQRLFGTSTAGQVNSLDATRIVMPSSANAYYAPSRTK